jgi:hypothetical protein
MTKQEVADFLENYNKWRRGAEDISQPVPKELGIAIELAVKFLRES